MKYLLFAFLLASCSSNTVVNNMADDIRQELVNIAEEVYALPPECGEQSKLAQRINMVHDRIDIMEDAYITETDDLKSKNRRLKAANDGMIIVLLLGVVLLAKHYLKAS